VTRPGYSKINDTETNVFAFYLNAVMCSYIGTFGAALYTDFSWPTCAIHAKFEFFGDGAVRLKQGEVAR